MRFRHIRKPLVAGSVAGILLAAVLPLTAQANPSQHITAGIAKQHWVTSPKISFEGGTGSATLTFKTNSKTNSTFVTFKISMSGLSAGRTYNAGVAWTSNGGGAKFPLCPLVINGKHTLCSAGWTFSGVPQTGWSTGIIDTSNNNGGAFPMVKK